MKPIVDYPNYGVTESGDVVSIHKDIPVRIRRHKDGYHEVNLLNDLGSKKFYVERLVMDAFVGPSKFAIDHINGIKTDNRLENLVYISRTEIILDFPNYGITDSGEVVSFRTGRLKTKSFNTDCYEVCLYNNRERKWFFVERLVMDAFVGPSELEIKHINGIKTDNRLENLEYVK